MIGAARMTEAGRFDVSRQGYSVKGKASIRYDMYPKVCSCNCCNS